MVLFHRYREGNKQHSENLNFCFFTAIETICIPGYVKAGA